ncbi:MAG: DUF2975 domain-containing protein [Alphaproteobacteria bacterium]|nr:DUF2975 domain-containing protein [Alphaproteobacteria bacterium]
MTQTSWLPKALRWMFTLFTVIAVFFTVCFAVLWLIDPQLPPTIHFGPHEVDIAGQPGSIVLQNSTFSLTALHGNVHLTVDQASGLVEVLKHYGLPVLILKAAFFAMMFELFRRLFRNVGRGESFTHQSLHLVQIIGVSLLVFSLVFAAAESWFAHATYAYVAQHAMIQISGTPLHLPSSPHMSFGGRGFPLGTPLFFSGLLVLALSEVFRQGLALKSENDLTV